MSRGFTPSRNFRLSDRTVEKLDALVELEKRQPMNGWYGGDATRSSMIRYLIQVAFENLEFAAREKLDAEIGKPAIKPPKRSQAPLPTRKRK